MDKITNSLIFYCDSKYDIEPYLDKNTIINVTNDILLIDKCHIIELNELLYRKYHHQYLLWNSVNDLD